MLLYQTPAGIILQHENQFFRVPGTWDALVARRGLANWIRQQLAGWERMPGFTPGDKLLPPIGSQEIWAAGVTYFRSKEARMEESKDAGGGSFYDKVYQADRPELFFKALPERVSGHGGPVRIRRDSNWNVPEPELTLFISPEGTIEGYTIGNDMSSRSIEGENPLYLPQAKTYQWSAALGPALRVIDNGNDHPMAGLSPQLRIHLQIHRGGACVVDQSTTLSQLKRGFAELTGWLFRETDFPRGVYLMTGTGIIPPDDFTLAEGDTVEIRIDGVGLLRNTVATRPDPPTNASIR